MMLIVTTCFALQEKLIVVLTGILLLQTSVKSTAVHSTLCLVLCDCCTAICLCLCFPGCCCEACISSDLLSHPPTISNAAATTTDTAADPHQPREAASGARGRYYQRHTAQEQVSALENGDSLTGLCFVFYSGNALRGGTTIRDLQRKSEGSA
jgi:hypothetical protein